MLAGARPLTPEPEPRKRSRTTPDHDKLTLRGPDPGAAYRALRQLRPGSGLSVAADSVGRTVLLKSGPAVVIEHERRMLEALEHPGIVRLIDSIRVHSEPVLVLEYLEGGDLVSLAGAGASHWVDAALALATTLAHLHSRGIVHRDLKSRHVMFDQAGNARLIDFGSAAVIGSPWNDAGTTPGTVDPRRSGAVSAADDVYAFAVVFHELLHGCLPGHLPAGRQGRNPAASEVAELDALVSAVLAASPGSAKPGLASLRAGLELLQQHVRQQ